MENKYSIPVKTPAYVLLSSDYSQQEPRITALMANDKKMFQAFMDGKDIYATIASVAYGVPYEQCLEFHPETHEYQPEGKKRRGEAKFIVLGICYGRSVPSIAEQLFGGDHSMTEKAKVKAAQKVYDSVLNAFPQLRQLMVDSQAMAKKYGYVTTFLGRRRHIPEMQLPEFEFKAMPGYVNPDIDPMDISTLSNKSDIPERIVQSLQKEFKSYKYFGQIVKRTKELAEEKIRVINNRPKINDGSRQCVNCVDMGTQILTSSGWRSFNDIDIGESIIALDTYKGELVSDMIYDIHHVSEPSNGVVITSPNINAITSENHRWWLRTHSGKFIRKTSLDLMQMSDSQRQSYEIPYLNDSMNIRYEMVWSLKFDRTSLDECWCVTTHTGSWIARRNNTVYITSNSRIQGGAADLTKLAILALEHSKDWQEIGGRLVNCIHDELLAEVPIDMWEEGGKILSEAMCKAADFMPFGIKCDVETTLRWYGLEYPCPYPKPESLYNMTEDEIKWLQYCLVELEYVLPIYNDVDGNKPLGDAARGVNGKMSDEMQFAIDDYKIKNSVADNNFIDHIYNKVIFGGTK